jgi:hypothetical protein
MQKLLGDLKEGETASNRNAAMGLAVAQTAVNELAARQQGQGAKAPKAIAGAEKGAITPVEHRTLFGFKSFGDLDSQTTDKVKHAAAKVLGVHHSEIKGLDRTSQGLNVQLRGESRPRHISERETRPIESAPLASQTRSRTAAEANPKYSTGASRHVSIDSLTEAISKYQQHIDSATALAILKRADACECETCQHKDEKQSEYDRLIKSLAAKGADDPKALAAAIGRKKLGKKRFQARAAAGARKAVKV